MVPRDDDRWDHAQPLLCQLHQVAFVRIPADQRGRVEQPSFSFDTLEPGRKLIVAVEVVPWSTEHRAGERAPIDIRACPVHTLTFDSVLRERLLEQCVFVEDITYIGVDVARPLVPTLCDQCDTKGHVGLGLLIHGGEGLGPIEGYLGRG